MECEVGTEHPAALNAQSRSRMRSEGELCQRSRKRSAGSRESLHASAGDIKEERGTRDILTSTGGPGWPGGHSGPRHENISEFFCNIRIPKSR